MRASFSLALGLLLASVPASASADCRTSSSGTYSVSVSLSPASGYLCLSSVELFEGRTCGLTPLWTTQLGCDETRRMVVSDRGVLVNLRTLRSTRRDWEVVRLFVAEDDVLRVRSVRLEQLPGLPADVTRVDLDLDEARLRADLTPAIEVPLATLETLGRVGGTRRLRRPR